jgi:hypothetical protein
MNFALNYKGTTTNTKGICVMSKCYQFSLLDGIDREFEQDKKYVNAYLSKHPKLEKRKGKPGCYFLKGYDFIESEAIKMGSTACYFGDVYWTYDIKQLTKYYKDKRMHFQNSSWKGSGANRMFYSYLYPEIIDALIDRMCKNADAIKEIAQYPNKYREKVKLENIKKDF